LLQQRTPKIQASLRGARDKIAEQFCAEATKQSSFFRWIASLSLAMTVSRVD